MATNGVNRSVFVSDLSEEVSEVMLLNHFSSCGPITSVRICRNKTTQTSLGYGYVNYGNSEDARHAVKRLDFSAINGKQIRVMTSQSDPNQRNANKSNVFVKNLDKSVDNKRLSETFSRFGEILSSKVALERNGMSKGFGFVQFDTEQSAINAIIALNGRTLNGKTLICSKFIAKTERQKYNNNISLYNKRIDSSLKFSNIYVKNLSQDFDENRLKQLFQTFGKVVSAKVYKKGSKCFGFVAFEQTFMAESAINVLNGKPLDNGQSLYVSRAHKRTQKRRPNSLSLEKDCKGVRVYVKYLNNSFDDQRLREMFSPFGSITSAKVSTNRNDWIQYNNGFGFVCFATQESAQKAVQQLNNRNAENKPLFVSIVQTIEEQKKYSLRIEMQRMAGIHAIVK